MKNFETLLNEIRKIARNITKEELKKDFEEYKEIYNQRDYDIYLTIDNQEDYIISDNYFLANTQNVFTNTYDKIA